MSTLIETDSMPFSPQNLTTQLGRLKAQSRSEVFTMPPSDVYVSHASKTGLPIEFVVSMNPRTNFSHKLDEAYERMVAAAAANPKGETNGDSSSIASMNFNPVTGRYKLVMQPTKFLRGRAMADGLSTLPEANIDFLLAHSPNMLNVSLIVITEIAGQRYLLCQEKGNARGRGQIHTCFAGNVTTKNLTEPNPLLAGLMTQARDEIGLPLNPDNLKPVAFVNEPGLGMFNVAYAAYTKDSEAVLTAFELSTKKRLAKLAETRALETRGVGFAATNALLSIPLNDNGMVTTGPIIMHRAKSDGSLEIARYNNHLARPYWQALCKLLTTHPELVNSWAENFELKTMN